MANGPLVLIERARAGDIEGVRMLLESGVSALATDDDGQTLLEYAVREARLDLVQLLLAFGANPDSALWVALCGATDEMPGHAPEVLAALLGAGASANWQDEDGTPALYWAARHPALMHLLLGRGANPNGATSRGETALSFACSWSHLESVQLLLSNGADPNYVLPDLNWSILFVAAQEGTVEVLSALLAAHADPTWTNERGQNALSVAVEHGRAAFARQLVERAPELGSRDPAWELHLATRVALQAVGRDAMVGHVLLSVAREPRTGTWRLTFVSRTQIDVGPAELARFGGEIFVTVDLMNDVAVTYGE